MTVYLFECVCGLRVLLGVGGQKTAETVIGRRERPALRAGVINTASATTDRQLSGSCSKLIELEAGVGGQSEVLQHLSQTLTLSN